MYEELMNDLANAQMQRPHVTCHSALGLLTISNLRENKTKTTLNIDIILIDGEPNEEGYYAFWNRARNNAGELLYTEPCIFKHDVPKKRFGIIYEEAVKHLIRVQQAFYEDRQEARAKREAEESEHRPEGDADYTSEAPPIEGDAPEQEATDYATSLPNEDGQEPPF